MAVTTERKQKLIDAKNAEPLKVGEKIGVKRGVVNPHSSGPGHVITVVVTDVQGDDIYVLEDEYRHKNATPTKITKAQIHTRWLWDVGANPFLEDDMSVRFVPFCLESVLFSLGLVDTGREEYKNKSGVLIKRCNWNPYVFDKDGNKQYYQRDFVWTLEQNQLLIESIYQRIECGRLLIRKRSWAECDKMSEGECAFNDIVDGKQRLNAVVSFMRGDYPDLHGNYYGDLSAQAQHYFVNHQLFSFAEMQENTPDEKVIAQFLKLNHLGTPQSKEHIEFVKSIMDKLTPTNK